jgi:hypothetical protein
MREEETNMIRNYVLCIAVILMLSSAASSQRLTGVWRLDEIKTTGANGQTTKITQPSMYLFTKSHYSIIYVRGDKPRSTDDPEKMTVEQLNDVYLSSFIANAGTYELKSGVLTTKVMVAKSPTYMQGGNWTSYKVNVTGNRLTLTTTATNNGPTKDPTTYTLTRVE